MNMKVTFFGVLLTATLLCITQASHAEVFRWVDESGKIRIGIKPSANPENRKNTGENNEKNNTEIKKPSPVIAIPVAPETIPEQTTHFPKTIKAPQTATPATGPAPAPVVTTPEIVAPVQTPVSSQPPEPAQKPGVKKPKPVREKTPVKKPVTRKKPGRTTPAKKKNTEKRSADERNKEMCGIFTGYVNDYKEKVRDCSPNLCDIYKRSLARYKKKQKSYCK